MSSLEWIVRRGDPTVHICTSSTLLLCAELSSLSWNAGDRECRPPGGWPADRRRSRRKRLPRRPTQGPGDPWRALERDRRCGQTSREEAPARPRPKEGDTKGRDDALERLKDRSDTARVGLP